MKKFNFRENMTQDAAESCAKKVQEKSHENCLAATYLNEDSPNGL
jgi:hypothetical protein